MRTPACRNRGRPSWDSPRRAPGARIRRCRSWRFVARGHEPPAEGACMHPSPHHFPTSAHHRPPRLYRSPCDARGYRWCCTCHASHHLSTWFESCCASSRILVTWRPSAALWPPRCRGTSPWRQRERTFRDSWKRTGDTKNDSTNNEFYAYIIHRSTSITSVLYHGWFPADDG